MAYLGDVRPNCGGTTYWAGSHKLIYPCFDQEYNFLPSEEFGEAHRRSREECEPVEVCGSSGDVVFMCVAARPSKGPAPAPAPPPPPPLRRLRNLHTL